MKPDPRTCQLLIELAEAAAAGQLHDVFIVYRGPEPYDYGVAYRVTDLEDMLFQVGTAIIQTRESLVEPEELRGRA